MYERIFPLLPVPHASWQRSLDDIYKRSPWLVKKLDRERRIGEHLLYLNTFAPGIYREPPGIVFDIGPGAGELLEILSYCGHDCLGIDAAEGWGGMGDDYLAATALLHERQQLMVVRPSGGFEGIRAAASIWDDRSVKPEHRAVLVNMRGSLEQVFAKAMEGPPHHEHRDCRWLKWNLAKAEPLFESLAAFADTVLRPGGTLLIHANGSANHDAAEQLLVEVMERCGALTLITRNNRVLKWKKNRTRST